MTDDWVVNQIPFFTSLDGDARNEIFRVMRHEFIPEGQVLIREGEAGDWFAIILEGQIEVIIAKGSPAERSVAIREVGDFMGEMSLLGKDHRRTATILARTPLHLLTLSHADFDRLVMTHPSFAVQMLRVVSSRLRESEAATIRDLMQKNQELEEAYHELKAAQAQIIEKEKIEHELRMARRIQESILPKKLPDIPGWKIQAYWQPAAELGGDFYDFIPLSENRVGIVIGDVSGKGVPAALGMATTHSILRMASIGRTTPGVILKRTNTQLQHSISRDLFVTCQYAMLDPSTGLLQFARAGHPFPVLYSSGKAAEIQVKGMALGMLDKQEYEECRVQIDPGSCLVMYSDGLSESHNTHGDEFGAERLISVLENRPSEKSWIDAILAGLDDFKGVDRLAEDDLTLLSIERLPV